MNLDYRLLMNFLLKNVLGLSERIIDLPTGFPFLELPDVWSRTVNLVWKLINTIFGYDVYDINDPKSNMANLMGGFIAIKKVFEDIGTYKMIRTWNKIKTNGL